MKPIKYTRADAKVIDLKTKVIYKYPTPTRLFDIGKMVVHGRSPEGAGSFTFETDCDFVMYVTKGSGKVFAGEDVFDVIVDDVVIVPKGNKFAIEGDLEYITVDVPAFYAEQLTEV